MTNSVKTLIRSSIEIIKKKGWKLFGISLFCAFIELLTFVLFGIIIGLAIAAVLVLGVSTSLIFLDALRDKEISCAQLFKVLKDKKTVGRFLGGMAWAELWILIWALIPVVGIVFAIMHIYSDRLVPYILAFEPEVSVLDARKVSEERMYGKRRYAFWADFIFVAAFFGCCLVLFLLGLIPYVGIVFDILGIIALLLFVAISPLYFGVVKANFFENIDNFNAIVKAGKKPIFSSSKLKEEKGKDAEDDKSSDEKAEDAPAPEKKEIKNKKPVYVKREETEGVKDEGEVKAEEAKPAEEPAKPVYSGAYHYQETKKWICPKCGEENNYSAKNCINCFAERPEEK